MNERRKIRKNSRMQVGYYKPETKEEVFKEKQREAKKQWYQDNKERLREYYRNVKRQRKLDPELNKRDKAARKKKYQELDELGRARLKEKQRLYRQTLKNDPEKLKRYKESHRRAMKKFRLKQKIKKLGEIDET